MTLLAMGYVKGCISLHARPKENTEHCPRGVSGVKMEGTAREVASGLKCLAFSLCEDDLACCACIWLLGWSFCAVFP